MSSAVTSHRPCGRWGRVHFGRASQIWSGPCADCLCRISGNAGCATTSYRPPVRVRSRSSIASGIACLISAAVAASMSPSHFASAAATFAVMKPGSSSVFARRPAFSTRTGGLPPGARRAGDWEAAGIRPRAGAERPVDDGSGAAGAGAWSAGRGWHSAGSRCCT
ncbi:hypothetical protein GA0115246_1154113 [Streptomyces sp. SolWspMP-sol7th]|nr:hypothetical protein GA0115246_1154113 [Streptomyces sp. SolWspMP-sol7th]